MSTTISGVALVTQRLRAWDALATTWLTLLADYQTAVPNDAAHWYNERATLSTLAGATWRTPGAMALEEYRCSRRFGKRTFLGRADLWFKLGAFEYVVEAKQAWPRRAHTTAQRVGDLLDAAASQLAMTDMDGAVPVSVVFVAPRFTALADATQLHDFVEACRKVTRVDLVAYHFDERVRGLCSSQTKAYYPGVVLVARREGG